MKYFDSIVIGGGLAGLACARTLHSKGASYLLLEASSHIGGRVHSHVTSEGLILDEGFQVLLDSYPEISKFLDLATLDLQKFNSGALIFDGEKMRCLANPLVHPNHAFSGFFEDGISNFDRFLTIKLICQCRGKMDESLSSGVSTRQFLIDYGFSKSFMQLFWEPFLKGVLLDPELEVDSHFFQFLISYFSTGRVSIPAEGMLKIPLQMAAVLNPENIKTNQRVEHFDKQQVRLKSGELIKTKQVIVAFDKNREEDISKKFHSVTTYYFTSPRMQSLNWDKWLILIPSSTGLHINHMCLISNVSAKYGSGKNLLSVSSVGPQVFDSKLIASEVNRIAKTDLQLSHVKTVSVPRALPKVGQSNQGFHIENEVIYCGDQWASPSINGAIKSGRLAAEYALTELNR